MPDRDAERLPQPSGGDYAVARLNALKHGVLSQFTILPWEDKEEYQKLLDELAAEHHPVGQTEHYLVGELASIMWRKRRVHLAERALPSGPAADLRQE